MATFHCWADRASLTDSELTSDDRARGAVAACPECGRLYDEHGRELGAPVSVSVTVRASSALPFSAEEEKPRVEKKPRAKKMNAAERKKMLLQKRLRLEQRHNPYFPGR